MERTIISGRLLKHENMRSASKTQLCDMVMKAWGEITPVMVMNSFKVCGQMPGCNVPDILPFRDGKACAEGRSKLESLWDFDPSMIDLDLLEVKASVEEMEEMVEVDLGEENTDEVFKELPDPEDTLM